MLNGYDIDDGYSYEDELLDDYSCGRATRAETIAALVDYGYSETYARELVEEEEKFWRR